MTVRYEEVSQRPRRRFHIPWAQLAELVGLSEGEVVEVNSGNTGLFFTVLEPAEEEQTGG